ncbi:MAG TPA: PilZ domain-containing protein [Candidatus Elarobacter sp.]|nr:PilZ domain-containing protein [Candidatus Elarobacter sp.]
MVYRGPDGTAIRGTTENMSRRGMLIVAQANASKGTRLRVAVTGADGREREVVGEVVRTTGDGKLAVELSQGGEQIDALLEEPPGT